MVVHVLVLVGFRVDVRAERQVSVAVAPLVSVAVERWASVAVAPLVSVAVEQWASVADAPLVSVAVEQCVSGVAAAEAFVRVHVDDHLPALTATPLIELQLQVVELTLANSVTVSVVLEHYREPALIVAHHHQ